MSTIPALGKAKAYIDVETGNLPMQPSQFPHSEDGPFVTISREAGSGGTAFGKALVDRLGMRADESDTPQWMLFESELVQQMLTEANLPARLSRYLPEDRIPGIVAAVGEVFGLHPDLWSLVQRTNETVRRLAILGHAVIVGRGGNFATAGVANGLNVRLIGSPAARARRLAEVHHLPIDEAAHLLRRIDTARRDYVRTAFDREIGDPTAYDLVINTDTLSTPEAVDAVLSILESRKIVPARAG